LQLTDPTPTYKMPNIVKYVIRNKEGDIYHETKDGSNTSYEEALEVMSKINEQTPVISWKDMPRLSKIYIHYIFETEDAIVH
jgi:dTDP-4-dehydrorhamnose reductase